jgi:transposase InsO family protein
MYLYVRPRWYYLVDILDAYSRFLVHWSLNRTLAAETVTLTVQHALDGLDRRRPGAPVLIHDHGAQFLSREWRTFVIGAGLVSVKTRVAHPESNGRLERLHRTHREEGVGGEELRDYYQAVDALTRWDRYYNYQRPHSALGYMPPIEYYRGDPAARRDARWRKLAHAAEVRKVYWREIGQGRQDPHKIIMI